MPKKSYFAIISDGLAAANGMSPSVTPTIPITRAEDPNARSSVVKYFLNSKVAIPAPNGATAIAAPVAA